MPYIKQEYRPRLNPHIEKLAEEIKKISEETGEDGDFAGFLNYSCTKLAINVMPARRYKWIAMIVGVFKNIADEFYRRVGIPYEDEQIEKNGDVFPADQKSR